MSAHLHKSYTNNFTITPNHIINDDRISLKAKGLYLYLISKPDNWSFSVDRIAKESRDGEDSVKSAIRELESFGYLHRSQLNKKGNFGTMIYTIFDVPKPSGENPPTVTVRGKTASGKTDDGKSPDLIKKREVKKNIREREKKSFSSVSADEVFVDDSFDVLATEIVGASDDLHDHDFPYLENFLDYVCKSSRVRNKLAYRSILRDSLLNPRNKRHKKTLYAYQTFLSRPVSSSHYHVNVFDLYDQIPQIGGHNV